MACNHPGVVGRIEPVFESKMQDAPAGLRMWFECAVCGQNMKMSALAAEEYNRKRRFDAQSGELLEEPA